MRFLLRFVLILLSAWLLQLFLPFWSAAVAAFVVGLLMSQKRKKRLFGKDTPPARAFLAGFTAVFLLWAITAWILDSGNGGVLSQQIFTLIFQDPNALPEPSLMMVLISASAGGLLAGLAAMTGNLLGEAIQG